MLEPALVSRGCYRSGDPDPLLRGGLNSRNLHTGEAQDRLKALTRPPVNSPRNGQSKT